jgi:cytochrome b561
VTVAKLRRKNTAAERLRFLHWLMAGFYFLLFAGGAYMTDLPKDISSWKSLHDFHRTLGVIVMSLLLARIFVLLRALQQKYRRRLPQRRQDWMQTFVHTALYFFMLLVPLSGYFLVNSTGQEIIIFSTNISLPHLFVENKQLGELGRSLHFWLSYTFLAVVILHSVDKWKNLRSTWWRFYKVARAYAPYK